MLEGSKHHETNLCEQTTWSQSWKRLNGGAATPEFAVHSVTVLRQIQTQCSNHSGSHNYEICVCSCKEPDEASNEMKHQMNCSQATCAVERPAARDVLPIFVPFRPRMKT